MNKKILFLSIGLAITLTGCGDKIVKMNEYKDINYSYHPRASTTLERDTYDMLLDDELINKKIEKYSSKLDSKLDDSLNDISSNQNNSNIMLSSGNDQKRSFPKNELFNDRFDKLKLNR